MQANPFPGVEGATQDQKFMPVLGLALNISFLVVMFSQPAREYASQ